jgi:ketosteroid isomerase-like protein
MEAPIDTVREIYAAWNDGNVDRMIEYWAPDGDWRWEDPPHFPDARKLRGRDEVEAHLRELVRLLGDMRVDLGETEVIGNEVVAQVSFTMHGAQSGIDLDVPTWATILLDDGHVRRYRAFAERDDAVRAARAEAS